MKVKLIVLFSFVVASTQLVANEIPKTFEELDADLDGYISDVEAKDRADLTKKWIEIDKDENGKLDISEYTIFQGLGRFTPPEDTEEPEPGAAPFEADKLTAAE